jgi:cytochrome bd-type quinol oxidase subunit 1
MWWRTENPIYGSLMRFWIRIFALGFGMGVVTGVVLCYQIGTNWSGFSRAVSNVLGPFFMYEVMTAFFLEAGFIGIVLFGEKRVGPGMHFFACLMVALGTLFSASWILAGNSWMQTPAGYSVGADGIFHVVDWWAAVFNPSFPYRFMHMVCASYLTGSFVVAGVSADHLWRCQHIEVARKAFSLALWAALVLAPLQVVLGDAQGRNMLDISRPSWPRWRARGLLLIRDELPGFLAKMESEEFQSDRAFYLEAFNGDGQFTYDRIGRGTVHIENCTLSIVGGVQPSRIAPLVRGGDVWEQR